MYKCVFCKWDVDLDDVDLNHGDGRVVCTSCFRRVVDAPVKRPSKGYRAELVAAAQGA